MKRLVLKVIFGVLLTSTVWGQDILQKTNKSKLEVKIIEIGSDEIKYRNYNDLEGPIYVISKQDVVSIQLENGEKIEFEKDLLAISESSNSHKRKAIMITPFGPIARHFAMGYQQWIAPKIIFDAKVGVIGVGLKPKEYDVFNDEKQGAFVTVGNKMMFQQLTYNKGTRLVHPLAGAYFKPQISFSYFTNKEQIFIYDTLNYVPIVQVAKFRNWSGAINLTIGKQWLIADIILLDIYVGGGYGFANRKTDFIYPANSYFDNNIPSNFHSHTISENWSIPISFTSGISIGLLL